MALRHWSARPVLGLKRGCDACVRHAPYLGRAVCLVGAERVERDCKMCGQCALSATGMTCPTNCGKRMRNGPCGGVSPQDMCGVVPDMRCVWVEATEGRKRIAGKAAVSIDEFPPIDNRRALDLAPGHRRHAAIQQLAEIEGVGGVHLMGHKNEGVLAQAIIELGLRATRTEAALQV